MALGTLTFDSASFSDVGNGRYVLATNTLGSPKNELKVSGGSFVKKANPPQTICSFTRILEFPVSTNPLDATAPLTPRRLNITVQIGAQEGVTPADIDNQLGKISTFLNESLIGIILNGGQ